MAAAVRGSSVVGGSGVTSLATGSFTSATGDTIGVWFNYGVPTDPTSVTDNKGNTYTQRGKVSRAGGFTAFHYTCENATGGAGTIVTLNIGFTEYPTLAAAAISGVVTSSVLDVLTTDGVDTAQPWTLSSGTLSQADEIVFGFLGSDSGTSTSTFTEGSGMTKLGEVTDSNLYWTGALAYVVVSATTARVQSWTSSVAGSNSTQIVSSFKAASGGGGVTGTVAWTEANDTAAITGALEVSGAPSWTEANDTATVAGSVGVSGAASWTEANDTAALAGAVGVSGSVAWTEANDSASIAGALAVSGSASWTEADDAAAITGTVGSGVSGSLSWTESDDTASLTGVVTQPVSGTIDWIEADDSWSLTGTSSGGVQLLGGGPGGPRKRRKGGTESYLERLLGRPLDEEPEPEEIEVVEQAAEVAAKAPQPPERDEAAESLRAYGLALKDAYVEIYLELEQKKRQAMEEEELMAVIAICL